MKKSIKILLWISGVITLYTSVCIFFGTSINLPHIVPYAIIMCFLCDNFPRSLNFLSFFALFLFTPVLTATDFLCAYYIDRNFNIAGRVAAYRSLITCLLGIFPILTGFLVLKPLRVTSRAIIIEGAFYFVFYGTLFSLLMMREKRAK
jgi:hypothetical protein